MCKLVYVLYALCILIVVILLEQDSIIVLVYLGRHREQ